MIEQRVIVTEVATDYLVVAPVDEGCHGCSQGGCGVSALSSLFGQHQRQMKVTNPGNIGLGEMLMLEMDGPLFLKSIFVQYLLPLIVVLAAILLGAFVGLENSYQPVLALLALIAGLLYSRRLNRNMGRRLLGGNFRFYRPEDNANSDKSKIHILSS